MLFNGLLEGKFLLIDKTMINKMFGQEMLSHRC